MIILKNEMFSCTSCLYAKRAQRCHHLKEKYLVSTKSSSDVFVNNCDAREPLKIDGFYRFKICTDSNQPLVKHKICPQNHQNDEILFHRDLKVDENAPIGPVIFILDDETKLELEKFLPTAELPVDNYEPHLLKGSLEFNNKMLVDFKFNKFKKRFSKSTRKHGKSATGEWLSVVIRPLDVYAERTSPMISCSKSLRGLSTCGIGTHSLQPTYPMEDPFKIPRTTLMRGKQDVGTDSVIRRDTTFRMGLGGSHSKSKKAPSGVPVKKRMEELLKDTELLLSSFLEDQSPIDTFKSFPEHASNEALSSMPDLVF